MSGAMSNSSLQLLRHSSGALVHSAAMHAQSQASISAVLPSGHKAIDALLPGGGWPQGALVELIQSGTDSLAPTQAVCSVLLPALCQLQQVPAGSSASAHYEGAYCGGSYVAWVGAVAQSSLGQSLSLFGPTLAAKGLDVSRLIGVQHACDTAKAWAAQELLRCADVAGVVVSLAQADAHMLRRLHYSAAQHGKHLWAIRPAHAAAHASPAVLRLQWCAAGWSWANGHLVASLATSLQVHKRAGTSTHAVAPCVPVSPALQQALRSTQAMRRLRRISAAPISRPVVSPHVIPSHSAQRVAA